MVECLTTLGPKDTIVFENHWNDHGSGQELVHHWFSIGSTEKDPFESFIYVWFAFNGWAQRVTGEEQDYAWLNLLGVDARLRGEFLQTVDSNQSVRQGVAALHDFSPIFRTVQQRRFGPPPAGTRAEHVKYWLSKTINGGPIKHRPACFEDDMQKTGSLPTDWPHILQAVYGVRCNLFHGSKSSNNDEDAMLVTWSRDVLVGFLSAGEYLGYDDPKSRY